MFFIHYGVCLSYKEKAPASFFPHATMVRTSSPKMKHPLYKEGTATKSQTNVTPYPGEQVSRSIRDKVLTIDLKGKPMKIMEMSAEEISQNVEMLEPLVRPYGCGPVAPGSWLVLRTYQKIIEVRDEMRFDEFGLCIGDRTFKRAYHQALRDIALYNAAGSQTQTLAQAAGTKGVPVDRVNGVSMPNARIRNPTAAIEHSFAYLLDKHWHRYLLPFGCYFFEPPKSDGQAWSEWKTYNSPSNRSATSMTTTATSSNVTPYFINPFSVTAADILYLCNTSGYLDRFLFVVGIILFAKKNDVNLLRHTRKHSDSSYRLFVTMEKHIHLFGSLYMHRKVLHENNHMVGGNWTESVELLDRLETECCTWFGVDKNSLNRDFDTMIVEKLSSLNNVMNYFPSAGTIQSKHAT
jgi:hypothetical protein